jgi:hypothetical protein
MVQEVDSRNLTKVITQKLSITSGVISEFLLSKLICFGVENVNFFRVPRL